MKSPLAALLLLSALALGASLLAARVAALQLGDVDCSNQVTSVDAALLLQLHGGLIPTLPCGENADARTDGKIDSRDATLILQYVAGLITHVGPPEYQMSVSSASTSVGAGAKVDVRLRGVQQPGISKLIVTLTYDARSLVLVSCTALQPGQVCATTDNVVWLIRTRGLGIAGDLDLASIEFQCTAPGTARLDLDLEAFSEASKQVRQVNISFEHGRITCSSEEPPP